MLNQNKPVLVSVCEASKPLQWHHTINKDGPLAPIVRQCECGPIAAGLVPRGNSREPPGQIHEDSANADQRGLPAIFV